MHRIGRTGRAGKTGLAITLATTRQKKRIEEIEMYTKSKFDVAEIPTPKQIQTRYQKNIAERILNGLEDAANNHTFDNLLLDLSRKTTDPTPIIIRLLELLGENEKRVYTPIDTVRPRVKPDVNRPVSNWVYVCLNVGSKENVRPNQLVNYLHDTITIHREHIGKIVIQKEATYLEVHYQALKYFKELSKKKYMGKPISYKQVRALPKR